MSKGPEVQKASASAAAWRTLMAHVTPPNRPSGITSFSRELRYVGAEVAGACKWLSKHWKNGGSGTTSKIKWKRAQWELATKQH